MKDLEHLFFNCAYDVVYDQAGDSVNYAFVTYGHILYIYFQGSNSISDWVRNFLFGKKPYSDMDIPYRVHRGFLSAWEEVKPIILDKILSKKTGERFDYSKIIIVGYSHGSALAGLCHEFVWFHRPDLRKDGLEGYGFESPRFYAGFWVKKSLRERWKTFTVIRTNNDIVTHCPPWIFKFCHVGSLLKIKGNTDLVSRHFPKFVKSHFPEVVLDALHNMED